jgi:hypothetical protein
MEVISKARKEMKVDYATIKTLVISILLKNSAKYILYYHISFAAR